jgi:hypothetical protein
VTAPTPPAEKIDIHLLPETGSEGRVHDLDRDCWCGPGLLASAGTTQRVAHRAEPTPALTSLYAEDDANPQWGVAYPRHSGRVVLRSSEWDAREEHMATAGAELYRRAVTYGPWVNAEKEIHYG